MDNFKTTGKKVKCIACGNVTALEETYQNITSWLCVECGYTSNTGLVEDSMELKLSPKTIQTLKIHDKKRNIYWIPSVVNIPSKGMLFPESYGKNIIWLYVPMVDIPEKEQKNYPIPDTENKFYKKRLDIEQTKKFTRFYDGLKEMGAII